MMRPYFISIICGFVLAFLGSCAGETVHPVKMEATLSAEGPLFEGSNTIQGDLHAGMAELSKSIKSSPGNLSSASLKSVTLHMPDSMDFDQFSGITLQFVSEKTDMVKIALINPVPAGRHEVQMTVAAEQPDLAELLKQDKFTVVADAILKKDSDAGITLKSKFEFLLTFKQ